MAKFRKTTAIILVIIMALSLCGIGALAEEGNPEYALGDTFTANSAGAALPANIPAETKWEGPVSNKVYGDLICGYEEGEVIWGTDWVEITAAEYDTSDAVHYKTEPTVSYYIDFFGYTQTYTGDRYIRTGLYSFVLDNENGTYGKVGLLYLELTPVPTTTYYKLSSTSHLHTDACYDSVTTEYTWTLVEKTYSAAVTVQYQYNWPGHTGTLPAGGASVTIAGTAYTAGSNGVVSVTLPAGSYEVSAVYLNRDNTKTYSGSGTLVASDGGGNALTITVADQGYTIANAYARYDSARYFDHIDIRAAGTITHIDYVNGVPVGAPVETAVTISNPSVTVYKADGSQLYHFEWSGSTGYEWRKTGLGVPKDARVVLTCDIEIDGATQTDQQFTFEGRDAFAQAIMNCEAKTGLDFIVSEQDITETFYYNVTYELGTAGSISVTGTAPADPADYVPDTDVTVMDITAGSGISAPAGYVFAGWKDTATGVIYMPDSKFKIERDTTLTAQWTLPPPEETYGMEVTKTVSGAALPDDFYIEISGGNLSELTETGYVKLTIRDEGVVRDENGVYHWYLENLIAGTYTATEYNCVVSGMNWSGTGAASVTIPAASLTESSDYDGVIALTNVYTTPYYPPVVTTTYTLTVKWVDGNGAVLDTQTRQIDAGTGYNADGVSGGHDRAFTNYSYKALADGSDPVSGTMDKAKTVVFLYESTAPAPTPTPTEPPAATPTPAPGGTLDESPKTGDGTGAALLWLAFCGSACGLVVLAITVPKKKRGER